MGGTGQAGGQGEGGVWEGYLGVEGVHGAGE